MRHFIDSVRDEVRIIKRLPKRYGKKFGFNPLVMQPISWSSEKYYFQQVCSLDWFHFTNKTKKQCELS
jgi:rhamnogalacturonan I rhamnosyltransferase